MIEANKKLIKANLTQGVAGVQYNLINLYQSNLIAISTQATLIGGFAFTAVSNINLVTENVALEYCFFSFFTLCLVTALIVLSQGTIVVMYGPALALKGADQASVKTAADYMRSEHFFVLMIGLVSITSLFIGSCILSWAIYKQSVAVATTVIYSVGYIFLIRHGVRAYKLFVPEDDVTLDSDPTSPGAAGKGKNKEDLQAHQQRVAAELTAAKEVSMQMFHINITKIKTVFYFLFINSICFLWTMYRKSA